MNNKIRTKNIKLCAYLNLKGINPVEVIKLGKGRGEFVFDLMDQQWNQHQIDFNNSDYIKYAHCIESIKDLCY